MVKNWPDVLLQIHLVTKLWQDSLIFPGLQFICSNMWRPYLQVIAARASQAVHILDRFHIMTQMKKAIDEVRATEARQLQAPGEEPLLKHTRWCLLKQPRNLSDKPIYQAGRVSQIQPEGGAQLALREQFQRFWEYRSAYYAGKFLDQQCSGVMGSRIGPMKKVAGTLRHHRQLPYITQTW